MRAHHPIRTTVAGFACLLAASACGSSSPAPGAGSGAQAGSSSGGGNSGAASSGASPSGTAGGATGVSGSTAGTTTGTATGTSGSGATGGSGAATGTTTGSSSGTGGSASGSAVSGVTSPDGGFGSSADGGTCTTPLANRVQVTEIDVATAVATTIANNEQDAGLLPIAISPIAGGGSRVAWTGANGKIYITTLDANDAVVAGSTFALPTFNGLGWFDFQDLYADANGGVLLAAAPSAAGGTLNCGTPANLCGTPPNPPIPCYDMYMVRFDGNQVTWATKVTDSTAANPPYLHSAGDMVSIVFIWWYAHNGRIAFDGSHYAGYFGAAISVSQAGCVNIHQGDRMSVVDTSGNAVTASGFSFGCSHSGYERVTWDAASKKFVPVCKNDLPTNGSTGKIGFAPNATLIEPVDLDYSDLGNVLSAGTAGSEWVISSNIRPGQTVSTAGLADVHLWQVTPTFSGNFVSASKVSGDTILAGSATTALSSNTLNDRAPHLAAYGAGQMVAAWEQSSSTPDPNNVGDLDLNDANRKMYVSILDRTTGAPPAGSTAAESGPLMVPVTGNRFQDFRAYPDGSVAYPARGSTTTKLKILRVLGCTQ